MQGSPPGLGPGENGAAMEVGVSSPSASPGKPEPVTWEDHSPAPLALEDGEELVSHPSNQAEGGVTFLGSCPWESFSGSSACSGKESSRGDATAWRKKGTQDGGSGATTGTRSSNMGLKPLMPALL